MPDTAHWILLGKYESDGLTEVSEETVVALLKATNAGAQQELLRLVPGRVWRDYREASVRRLAIHQEIRQLDSRPKLIAVADRSATKSQPTEKAPDKGAINPVESGSPS